MRVRSQKKRNKNPKRVKIKRKVRKNKIIMLMILRKFILQEIEEILINKEIWEKKKKERNIKKDWLILKS